MNDFQTLADTNALSSASWQYRQANVGMRSTQQLNVDWSQFQNHTFFMSAEAKVNLAFDQVINGYPFDGSRQDTEVFFDNLTGFDKWVFDNFPTFHGELLFDGTNYIAVRNKVGSLFPELVANDNTNTGVSVLNPTGSQSMTIEMQIYLPPTPNSCSVICQMLNDADVGNLGGSTQGFQLYLTSSASSGSVNATFVMVSGSNHMTVPVTLNKGVFNHVAVELNRDNGLPYLESFLLSLPANVSAQQTEMDDLDISESMFLIGSGTKVQVGDTLFTPTTILSGAIIDEFRVFFSARTPQQQAAYASKALYTTSDLVLYFKFNEPTGSLDGTLNTATINSVALDSSGNSLHTLISNFSFTQRLDTTLDPLNPVSNERPDQCPVLFPAYPYVVTMNQTLLASASLYDQENPNLITKLIPQHYLLEGAMQDGFTDPPEGNEGQPFGGNGVPGQGKMGNVQIMVSLLYLYARFFDEIKLFIDAFSTLQTVDYDTGNVVAPDTVPDNFLLTLVQEGYGFFLPPLFQDSDIDQYVRGENVEPDQYSTNTNTLRFVQNTLTRRVLKTLPTVLRSKGTQHSIKAFLRAVGIDPDNIMRLRELGGPTTQALQSSRDTKFEQDAMLWFSGSNNQASTIYVSSPYLSASRTEPGFPLPVGTFKTNNAGRFVGTNNANDGLLTSGSWTWEGIVKFTPSDIASMQSTTQSLARLCVTGTLPGITSGSNGIVANLIAISSSFDAGLNVANAAKLILYIRPGMSSSSPVLRLELDTPVPDVYTGPVTTSIFDYDRWNVSFGRQRGDDGLGSPIPTYFLRLAYQNNGSIMFYETTGSFFKECPNGESNVFEVLNTSASSNGAFLAVGQSQLVNSGTGNYMYLNQITSTVPSEARSTSFTGRMSNTRFWSKALSESEWKEHVRNYSSTGVEDPLSNWNYAKTPSGSWGRLRMDAMTKQDIRTADANGNITIIDFSENLFHLSGQGFTPKAEAVVGETFDLSFFNPYFDEAATNEKVRIRSFLDYSLVQQTPWASLAPLYEINPSEKPTDDTRFIMEFSLVEALNRDIVAIFSTLDALDNALGEPDLAFSPDYPDLETLRNIYFNRIKAKLNFDAFFVFFRWFDSSIGTFISQLIPRKTNFKGINFTIESHMLERHKMDYSAQSQIYLGDSIRTNLDSVLLLQLIEGSVSRY